ncbi:hypothetical protein DPMN_028163 [Dreissena polymorpha]|uniref:Uncharacterized protein n=1 Tax=Dreissena polymorpha TaxID=45954 RepID=A0A9D4REA9_DREPO|nr:hypothetical protein DPMN_028163 [Dreissena polymorpha]
MFTSIINCGGQRRVNYTEAQEEQVEEMLNQFEHADVNDVLIATSSEDNHEWSANLKIGCKTVRFEIDSGAMCIVMSYRRCRSQTSIGAPKVSIFFFVFSEYMKSIACFGLYLVARLQSEPYLSARWVVVYHSRGKNNAYLT